MTKERGCAVSNWLVVESKNDQAFFQALVQHLNIENVKFNTPVCHIDDFECMDGLNVKKLTASLRRLRNEFAKTNIRAIGILLDHDGKFQQRLDMVNQAGRDAFDCDLNFTQSSESRNIVLEVSPGDEITLRISFCLVGVGDRGELETVLKAIYTQEAIYADCLDAWRDCLKEQDKPISDKDFEKAWLNNYIRYDTCSRKERKQAGRKCSMSAFEYVMKNKPAIWDFDHPVLAELKAFLNFFCAV